MELLAKAKTHGVVLVEPDRHDGATTAHNADRLLKGDRRTRALEGDGDAVGTMSSLDGRRDIQLTIGFDRLEPSDAAIARRDGRPIHDVNGIGAHRPGRPAP